MGIGKIIKIFGDWGLGPIPNFVTQNNIKFVYNYLFFLILLIINLKNKIIKFKIKRFSHSNEIFRLYLYY